MSTERCPNCQGSGYHNMSGVMPRSQQNEPLCMTCNGSGYVEKKTPVYEQNNTSFTPQKTPSYQQSGCFPSQTKIMTPIGWKAISAITENDLVLAINISGEFSFQRVLEIKKHPPQKYMKLYTNNNQLSVTNVHSLQTSKGWAKVSDLSVGSTLQFVQPDQSIVEQKLIKLEQQNEPLPVFNLIVEKNYTFIADGFIAHSFTYLKTLRILFWNMKQQIKAIYLQDKKTLVS